MAAIPEVMKAVYIERYGGPEVLQVGLRPRPQARPGQVLVEVHAAAVNPRDWLLREGRYQFRHLQGGFPLILGSDVSGVVAAVGAGVQGFMPGDAVFGMQSFFGRMGGYAEYVAIDAAALAHKPVNISHIEAAAAPCAALTAYGALVKIAGVTAGARVLVIGGSGGVGSYAVQLAQALGATVTAVTSAGNAELVRSLGAERVIDYRAERFAAVAGPQDCVFDTLGRESLASCAPVLAPRGRYITTIPGAAGFAGAALSQLRRAMSGGRRPSSHVVMVQADGRQLAFIAELLAQGRMRSLIDSVYPLAQARAAHERSRTWRSRGKLVLSLR